MGSVIIIFVLGAGREPTGVRNEMPVFTRQSGHFKEESMHLSIQWFKLRSHWKLYSRVGLTKKIDCKYGYVKQRMKIQQEDQIGVL
jgi:hypothetical protein